MLTLFPLSSRLQRRRRALILRSLGRPQFQHRGRPTQPQLVRLVRQRQRQRHQRLSLPLQQMTLTTRNLRQTVKSLVCCVSENCQASISCANTSPPRIYTRRISPIPRRSQQAGNANRHLAPPPALVFRQSRIRRYRNIAIEQPNGAKCFISLRNLLTWTESPYPTHQPLLQEATLNGNLLRAPRHLVHRLNRVLHLGRTSRIRVIRY